MYQHQPPLDHPTVSHIDSFAHLVFSTCLIFLLFLHIPTAIVNSLHAMKFDNESFLLLTMKNSTDSFCSSQNSTTPVFLVLGLIHNCDVQLASILHEIPRRLFILLFFTKSRDDCLFFCSSRSSATSVYSSVLHEVP